MRAAWRRAAFPAGTRAVARPRAATIPRLALRRVTRLAPRIALRIIGVAREKGFSVLRKSGLETDVLEHIWKLADVDGDGVLDPEEFILAMHLTNAKVKMRIPLPERLPMELLPPGKALRT